MRVAVDAQVQFRSFGIGDLMMVLRQDAAVDSLAAAGRSSR